MTTLINIGTDPTQPADDTVTLSVAPGATVNVAVVGSTVSYYNSGLEAAATGTITTGNNQNFTVPSILQSASKSTLTITGGTY